MVPSVKRGYGAAGPAPTTKVTPRMCISPQLAPPVLSKADKKAFANTESYHKK